MKEENNMINPFKLIHKIDELPPELKREVMATINYAHLITDVSKLFSIDMAHTVNKLIDPLSDEND